MAGANWEAGLRPKMSYAQPMPDLTTGVVVIGGGSSGAGVLRDLALRGIDAVLVEKGELASGTTGRSHGLLHSGARYCVDDPPAALQCAQEGSILRRIAPGALNDTGGLFVSVSEEDLEWEPLFVAACRRIGIQCERISLEEARRREPRLSTNVRTVFSVPGDAVLKPVNLVRSTIESAQRAGAGVLTGSRVTGFLRQGSRVHGVVLGDHAIECQEVVNASGAWAGQLARLLQVDLRVTPIKGSMVVLARSLTGTVINRCHRPDDGDIIVPAGEGTVLGTTSTVIDDPEQFEVEEREAQVLIREGMRMLDGVEGAPRARTYAGVRPIYDPGREGDGRQLSRDFSVIDHRERDGVSGFTSIVGGKVTTYRLMAERAADLVAHRLGVATSCTTAEAALVTWEEPAATIKK
jgi:glycerol-3-phosphate dehydrogenase